jgi:DNA repair exonuclease SbcCD ATPase subunit
MVEQYRRKLDQLKGQQIQLLNQIKVNKSNISSYKKEKEESEQAQKIIQIVAKQTQDQIIVHISSIITMALQSIFDEDYEFKIDFVEKRGKTEAEIYFLKDGKKNDPLNSSGGGIVDIASLILRISLWSLSNKTRLLILDEPLKFLSKEYISKAIKMITELSKKLNLQFIIVTHINEMIDYADKVFGVSIRNRISKIEN